MSARDRRGNRGISLAELLIACTILGMLLSAVFMIYRMGAQAWLKSDAKSELLQVAQIVSAKVNREVEGSSYRGLEISADGSGLAFPSAKDLNGVFVYDPVAITPIWQKYQVIYFDASKKALFQREVPLAGLPQQKASMPIKSLGQGTVDKFFSNGVQVAHGMDTCRFSVTPSEQLVVELSASKVRYGSPVPEKQSVRVVTALRNR